jgi:transposase-like protein
MVNKIKRFFRDGAGKYQQDVLRTFHAKIGSGASLRELAKFLDYSCQLKVSHSTVARYIKEIQPELREQRQVEKLADKAKKILSKISLKKEKVEEPCNHPQHALRSYWNLGKECTETKCTICGKVFTSFNPSSRSSRTRYKEQLILEALQS